MTYVPALGVHPDKQNDSAVPSGFPEIGLMDEVK